MVRFIFRFFIAAAFALSAQFAMAQGTGQVAPTPAQILSQYHDGGPDMVKQVSDLVSSDKTTIAAILEFARTADEDQRKAIAEGLAQVAKANAQNDPGFANQIQQAVAASGIPELAKAYAEAAGDTGTASIGGGGAGGGPSGPGAPSGGANIGGFPGGNTFSQNNTPNLLTGQSLGGASSSQISGF